jgi:hypothetical protein
MLIWGLLYSAHHNNAWSRGETLDMIVLNILNPLPLRHALGLSQTPAFKICLCLFISVMVKGQDVRHGLTCYEFYIEKILTL